MWGGSNVDIEILKGQKRWKYLSSALTQTASRIEPICIGGMLCGSVSKPGSAHTLVNSIPPSSKAMDRPWKPGFS